MTSLLRALAWLALAAGALLAGPLRRRGGRLRLDPRDRDWLASQGLTRADDFLALESLVVSGHPGRRVLRLRLGDAARTVYLKRQHAVGWTERLRNWWNGRGWASNSVAEAGILEELERKGLPAPRCLAAGEGRRGAFLLVEGVRDGVALPQALRAMTAPQRRRFAAKLGRLLARFHAAGFAHRDLYAKHVLLGPGGEVTLLDWQRAVRRTRVSRRERARDLAALHATLPEHLAGRRERLVLLRAYRGTGGPPVSEVTGGPPVPRNDQPRHGGSSCSASARAASC
jgi:tRNA A-37 threonylcarbamoyl transferase component Bud32